MACSRRPSFGKESTSDTSYPMKESLEQKLLEAYDTYADAIFRFCRIQVGDRDLAYDLTQDTFVRTWRYLISGKGIDQMRPFLYRTARNAIIDHVRRTPTESLDALQEKGFDAADAHADPSVSVQVSQVLRSIRRLEPPYREAVTLRYVDDLAPREIAAMTGESENVISVRIHRGLQKLRDLLNP